MCSECVSTPEPLVEVALLLSQSPRQKKNRLMNDLSLPAQRQDFIDNKGLHSESGVCSEVCIIFSAFPKSL